MNKFDLIAQHDAEVSAAPDLKAQFEDVLAEFDALVKQDLALDADGTATFSVDDEILVNLKYLEGSDTVVVFAPVGAFGGTDAPDAGDKALELLRLCELGGPAGGFTLALDADADLVLAMDRRLALEISSADALAAWTDALVRAVRAVRERFAERFPAESAVEGQRSKVEGQPSDLEPFDLRPLTESGKGN
ncbi:MAG: type III secretion system chaperone [Kiritimatiellae bacterium]|nr:type III secretion system chaperone [Kiritimatiellia bacterium]